MPEPPRPKRFQIHLSTAIAMMFVAGGLTWANVRINKSTDQRALLKAAGADDVYMLCERGWPLTCHEALVYVINIDRSEGWGLAGSESNWINLLAAFTALILVWLVCEWLIRRRAARKEA
jgi:hypothetical protein